MNEDAKGALADNSVGRRILEPLAKADPSNRSFQEDMVVLTYGEARAFVLLDRLAEARGKFQLSLSDIESSSAAVDSIDNRIDSGAIWVWLGEVDARLGRSGSALEDYRHAIALLTPDAAPDSSDYRHARLAAGLVGRVRVLIGLGGLAEAEADARRALDAVTRVQQPELNDVPARYAAANAQGTLGDAALVHTRVCFCSNSCRVPLASMRLAFRRWARPTSRTSWRARRRG